MKYISILGSSGSIGTQALNFIAQTKNEFKVCGLTVNKNTELLKKQVLKFKPEAVCIYDDTYVEEFKTWAKKEVVKQKLAIRKQAKENGVPFKKAWKEFEEKKQLELEQKQKQIAEEEAKKKDEEYRLAHKQELLLEEIRDILKNRPNN